MAAPQSDADLRDGVIYKASLHNIHLMPGQVVIRRSGTEQHPIVFFGREVSGTGVAAGICFAISLHSDE